MSGRPPVPGGNVLFLHHGRFAGGAERSLCDLARGLAAVVPPDVGFLSVAPRGFVHEALAGSGVATAAMPLLRFRRTANPILLAGYLVNWLAVAARLIVFCKRRKVRVLYANSLQAFLYAVPVAILLRLKLFVHLRDRARPFILFLLRTFADRVVCISAFIGERIAHAVPERRRTVVHNAIDRKEQFVTGRAPGRVVGYAGQLIPWKRVDLLIEAMRGVAASRPGSELLIAGADLYGDHPEYRRDLEAMALTPGLRGRVLFLGWVEDLRDFLCRIDVLVLPSRDEPFGRVLIEAMWAGVPTVGVRSGAIPEIIDHERTGLLTEATPDAIASAIGRVFDDAELRTRMTMAARREAEGRFGMERLVSEISGLLREAT